MLAIVKEMDPGNDKDDLKNAAEKLEKKDRFTSWWDINDNGKVDEHDLFTSIDHILVPVALFEKIETVAIPKEQDVTKVSDHYPVIAVFDLTKE